MLSLSEHRSYYNVSTLPAGGSGWVTSNRSVVVHCLHQLPAELLVSCCLYMCRTNHICSSAYSHEWLCSVLIVLNQFLPPALSQMTISCLLKKVNTPARNLPVLVKGQDLTKHWWKMLIAKIENTECSAVFHQACTKFCSGCKRLNFNYTNAGFKKKSLSACLESCMVVHIFSRHCICNSKKVFVTPNIALVMLC